MTARRSTMRPRIDAPGRVTFEPVAGRISRCRAPGRTLEDAEVTTRLAVGSTSRRLPLTRRAPKFSSRRTSTTRGQRFAGRRRQPSRWCSRKTAATLSRFTVLRFRCPLRSIRRLDGLSIGGEVTNQPQARGPCLLGHRSLIASRMRFFSACRRSALGLINPTRDARRLWQDPYLLTQLPISITTKASAIAPMTRK